MYQKRICNIALLITSILVYVMWSSLAVCASNLPHSVLINFLLFFIVGYGFFHLCVSLTKCVLEKSETIKRIIFGSSYLEGTWIGYYIWEDKTPVIFFQIIEQNIDYIYVLTEAYHLDKSLRCTWHSISDVSVDARHSSLLYLYQVDSIGKNTCLNGLFISKYLKRRWLCCINNPFRIHGYAFNLNSSIKTKTVQVKTSNNVIIRSDADIGELLQKALEFYECEMERHPHENISSIQN